MNYKEFININEGGARIPSPDKMTPHEFRNYFRMGLDKPSSYRSAHWQRAVDIMNIAHKLGYVKPMDLGRGKGKYSMVDSSKNIDQVADLIYKSKDRWM